MTQATTLPLPVPAGLNPSMRFNEAWPVRSASASLCIVIPFFASDPAPLAARLLEQMERIDEPVALLFMDDGTPDTRFAERLWEVLHAARQPAALAVLPRNAGRAKVRNELARLSPSPYLLYMDADMWPDDADFVRRYLDWSREGSYQVLYGGRSARHVVLTGPEYAVHKLLTDRREALPAAVRRTSPAFHFFSCNFLVRREVLQQFPLDEQFDGWGWEDCEWAARVALHCEIRHEDNTASHLGLLKVPEILRKYDESPGNFIRILALQPDMIRATALYKVARLLRITRLGPLVRAGASRLALADRLPAALRIRALMFYKAALYSTALAAR